MNRNLARGVADAAVAYIAAQRALEGHGRDPRRWPREGVPEPARAAWWAEERRLFARAVATYEELQRLVLAAHAAPGTPP